MLSAALLLAAFSPLVAQENDRAIRRRGAWFSAGAGIGFRLLSCETCIGSLNESGAAVNLRLGSAIARQWTAGVNVAGWMKKYSEAEGGRFGVFSTLMGVVQFYPLISSDLYLQGGGGFIVDVVDDDLVIDAFGLSLGTGFDIRMSENFSLTPMFSLYRSLGSGNVATRMYHAGIALTWH